jgi:hypothetical protein
MEAAELSAGVGDPDFTVEALKPIGHALKVGQMMPERWA